MVFTHDTEVALRAAAALVNSAHTDPDGLATTVDLDRFVVTWGWTGSRRHDHTELAAVTRLRPRLASLWSGAEEQVVEQVNTLLRETHALPQLVRHDEWDWHIHATPDAAPLADRMAVEAAMAVSDVVRAGELARLTVCAAPDCSDVVVDLSKNRSRRFCSTTCANRVNVAAFRARQATG